VLTLKKSNVSCETIHTAYPEFKDLFKKYLSVTMSNTAPNVDADSYNEINESDNFRTYQIAYTPGKITGIRRF